MYQVPKSVPFGGTLQYVFSCPRQLGPNMAFCVEHCEMAEEAENSNRALSTLRQSQQPKSTNPRAMSCKRQLRIVKVVYTTLVYTYSNNVIYVLCAKNLLNSWHKTGISTLLSTHPDIL